jgi:hypothetical protein
MISPPMIGTKSAKIPRPLPAGETSSVLTRWKKNRLVNSPMSLSSSSATKALRMPMPIAMIAIGITR